MLTNTTCSNEVNYCNDFFFKYALGSEDEIPRISVTPSLNVLPVFTQKKASF